MDTHNTIPSLKPSSEIVGLVFVIVIIIMSDHSSLLYTELYTELYTHNTIPDCTMYTVYIYCHYCLSFLHTIPHSLEPAETFRNEEEGDH